MKTQVPAEGWNEKPGRGDREAFERLIEEHRGRLESVIRIRMGAQLRQWVEAEDVLQETILKAFQSIHRFQDSGGDSFFHWLRGIAENLILHLVRQEGRRTTEPLEAVPLGSEPLASSDSPSKGLRREERLDRLLAALESLSPEHREVIQLASIDGLPMKEIATRMGRTPNAASQLLWRALGKLKASFGDTESFRLPPRPLRDDAEGGDHAE